MLSYLWVAVVFGSVIAFHEFGHFVFAKLFGVKIDRFSIGFGPVLLKKRLGETEYALSALPLGGYVKMASSEEAKATEDVPERGRAFEDKPLWQRLIIFFAGPAFNFLLALLVYIAMYGFYGVPTFPNVIGGVAPGSPAEAAGLKAGEKVVMIRSESAQDFVSVHSWDELVTYIRAHGEEQLLLVVERDNKPVVLKVTPVPMEGQDQLGQKVQYRGLGIQAPPMVFETSDGKALSYGFRHSVLLARMTGDVYWRLVTFRMTPKVFGGPVMIAQQTKQTYEQTGIPGIFNMIANISVNVMWLNLFPFIAMLDGGQIFLMLVQAVIRRPLPPKVKAAYLNVSAILLLLLMVYATTNDLLRH